MRSCMQSTEHGDCHTLSAGRMEAIVIVAAGGSRGPGNITGCSQGMLRLQTRQTHGQWLPEKALFKNEILVKRYKGSW